MYLGIFDQDVGDHLSLLVPQLYYKGIQQTLYNTQRFWLYIADGVYQSVVSFFVMYTIFFDSSMDAKGQEVSKDAMGTFLAYSIILTVNIYALMCASDLSWVGFASFAVVIGIWIIYCVSYSFVPEAYTFGVTVAFYKNPNFYAGIILSVTLCLLPRLTAKFLQQYFWPSDTDIMREIQKYRSKDIRQVLNEITGHPITNEMLPSDEVLAGDVESLKDDRSVMSAKSGFVPRESPEVTSGPRSKSEEQLPPSQESGKKKRRVQSAFSLKEKPPKVSDGFGANADKDNSGAGSSDLEQAHHKSEDIDKPSSSRIVESEGRFRKSSVSVIIKENIQKATRFVQKLGRQVSSRPPVRSEARSSSIIYMGDNVAVNNTGFAFSQDKGMTRVITQSPLATPLYEDPYEEEVDLSLIPPPRIASGKGSSRELSRREDSTSQIGSSKRIDGPATLGRFLEPRRPSGLRQSQLYASIDDAIEEGTDMLRGRSDPGSDGIRFEIQASTPEMTEVFPDAVGSSSQSLAVEGPEEPGSAEASPAPFVSGRATPTQENAPTDVTQEPIPTPPSDIPDVVPNVSEQISTLGVPSVERDGKTQISDPTDANSVPVSDTNAQPETDLS